MANKNLFGSSKFSATPTDAINEAGGVAYDLTSRQALARLVCTGCLNDIFYADAETTLNSVIEIARRVDSAFLAKCAVYARHSAYMKDMPALLIAILAERHAPEFSVFPKVIDNGKMLRNFCQIIRSGQVGRKSFGTRIRRFIREWLENRNDEKLFRDSVGNDPSLIDIIKMVHPKPHNHARDAFFKYLLGKEYDKLALCELASQFERFKSGEGEVPDVPFQMIAGLDVSKKAWEAIFHIVNWTTLRMNLNTFLRHGVFDKKENVLEASDRLRNRDAIQKSRVFPYQLLMAYTAASGVDARIRDALQDATEIATDNVPELNCNIIVCPDVSGSMNNPITGYREGSTSAVKCVDVAALMTATIVRKNRLNTTILPFAEGVRDISINPRDSIMTIARQLASILGGGTSISAPLILANHRALNADIIIYISDNQSWADARADAGRHGSRTAQEWKMFKKRNPAAKIIMIDLQPYTTGQLKGDKDTLFVGGFSDNVFETIKSFIVSPPSSDFWVEEIDKTQI